VSGRRARQSGPDPSLAGEDRAGRWPLEPGCAPQARLHQGALQPRARVEASNETWRRRSPT